MEKICMINLKDIYALGYSSYSVDENNFIERINDKHKPDNIFKNSDYLIPMMKIEENNKVKYVELLTGKEFYPQVYTEEETRKLFPHISNWKKVYEITRPFESKDGSIRFMEGNIRYYEKNSIYTGNKAKLLALKLKKMYIENSLLYKIKMNEQERVKKIESKLKNIKKISR